MADVEMTDQTGLPREVENAHTGNPPTENPTTENPTTRNPTKENPLGRNTPDKDQAKEKNGNDKEKGLLDSRHAKAGGFTRALEEAVNRKKREMDKQAATIRRVTEAFDMAEEKATPKKDEEGYEVFHKIFSTLKAVLDGAIQKTLAGSELSTAFQDSAWEQTNAGRAKNKPRDAKAPSQAPKEGKTPRTTPETTAPGKPDNRKETRSWAQKTALAGQEGETVDVRSKQVPKARPVRKAPQANRLLARLFPESKWKEANPAIVKTKINNDLFEGKEVVTLAKITQTGFAITLTEDQSIMEEGTLELIRNYLDASALEKETVWEKFLVKNVPRNVHDVTGKGSEIRRTTLEDVRAEVQKAFGGELKILDFREYKDDPLVQGLRVAVLNPEKIPKTVELLGSERVVRKMEYKPLPPPRCTRCWRKHRTETCSYAARCALCGETKHKTESHKEAAKCSEHKDKECECTLKCPICAGKHSAEKCDGKSKN
ncbi:hypothetical protein CFIMG_006503RA [Ceratocystis fimbriata CBS 114723]|uniref:Uncharacterized protein n=1 Tax=Ceratocystis fimbriata CBS 114723 TaxID=1035309 RepID=A0A2C5WVN9_9PEZI|nr:hypothetical protein CFIMG_006503RA [Ceratocystis fimbriata CBS 114723]